ncbi:ligand-binding sensor domain-containing protein [Spirosoma pollinicola]|uniref:histidine kinase n=1 Tax=Spirosoma pollinicola TaxID=2057025 RepID=A0A2K8Z481_9BACT|nr:sensor histidine kinase [Spirosoma pollinicola]AUD04661.1 histidine kinase [Spirosoma pollinicola]
MSVRVLCLLWVVLGFAQPSEAQSPTSRFTYLTTNQGLSQNNVTCILKDRRGFMWFGTRDGLNKFDGYTYTLYRNDPLNPTSLSHSHVHALLEDKQGRLWVGTDDGGLNLFDARTETFTHYKHTPGRPNSLAHNRVLAIAQDARGFFWVGTGGGGLDRFDSRQKTFTHFTHQPQRPGSLSHNQVKSVYIDQKGVIWVGTLGGGLNKLNPSTASFTHYIHNPADPHSLSQNRVTSCLEDSQGRFWVGTESGLNLLDRLTGHFTPFVQSNSLLSHNDVKALAEDDTHTLWIGTQNGGISLLHPDGTFSFYTYQVDNNRGLNSGSIYCLYRDTIGTMWIGTYSGGVNKLDAISIKFDLYQRTRTNANKLSNNNILAVLEDKQGDLWLGTDGGGINVIPKGQTVFKAYQDTSRFAASMSRNFVITLYEDRDKQIWTGNYKGGLTRFNRVKNTFESKGNLSPLSISAILEARNGILWLGTFEEGLIRYDKATGLVSRYPARPGQAGQLNYHTITALWEDRRGNIWIGTDGGGINVFHLAQHTFTQYMQDNKNPGSLSSNQVNTLFESTSHQLWVGTSGGLNRFDARTQTFTAYRQRDGLTNEVIQGILEDKRGRLWLSTDKGLSSFDPRTRFIRNYDAGDGLQESSFNRGACYKSLSGQLFFGGLSGLNSFYPDSLRDNPVIPPVYLTDFQLFNQSVRVGDGQSVLTKPISDTRDITLSYQQSVLSFGFAALNYTVPEKNQYAYKLEGFDQHWIRSGTQRRATYTNLDPGDYVFRVKGANNDGVWNQTGTFVRLHIIPPVWQTTWFESMVFFVILGSLYALYRLRVRHIQARQIALQNQLNEQTRQATQQKQTELVLQQSLQREKELNQLKSQFVATASHEFRTPLATIQSSVDLVKLYLNLPGAPAQASAYRHLDVIEREIYQFNDLLTDILTIGTIEAGKVTFIACPIDFIALCDRVIATHFSNRSDQRCVEQQLEGVPYSLVVDEKLMSHVLVNLLSNAFKFSLHSPPILRLCFKPDSLLIQVIDAGIGIPANELSTLFQAFSRASNTNGIQGTGLGLVIVRQFIDLHGGQLHVESQEKVGTTFSVTLPHSQENE